MMTSAFADMESCHVVTMSNIGIFWIAWSFGVEIFFSKWVSNTSKSFSESKIQYQNSKKKKNQKKCQKKHVSLFKNSNQNIDIVCKFYDFSNS